MQQRVCSPGHDVSQPGGSVLCMVQHVIVAWSDNAQKTAAWRPCVCDAHTANALDPLPVQSQPCELELPSVSALHSVLMTSAQHGITPGLTATLRRI